MSSKSNGFRSEAELAKRGRYLLQTKLREVNKSIKVRCEVRAPGTIPDLILYSVSESRIDYVVTIEFKLSRWRRAINQAFRQRNFGNEAYVVLDDSRASAALRNLAVFREANVGLATVHSDDSVRIWHYPKPRLPFSLDFSRCVAELLLGARRSEKCDIPFVRTTRGGRSLSALRTAWSRPD